jgi:hypothetical protein
VVWWHPDGHELQGADWADAADRAMAVRLLAVEPEPLAAQGGQLTTVTPTTTSTGALAEQIMLDAALLIVLNPLEAPRDFVLPPGDWTAEFCSANVDGAPAPAGSAAAVSALASQAAVGQFVRVPAHTLRVYRAPRASLGEPDVSPMALQRGFATAWPEPTDFSPTSAGSLFVDRRGEP